MSSDIIKWMTDHLGLPVISGVLFIALFYWTSWENDRLRDEMMSALDAKYQLLEVQIAEGGETDDRIEKQIESMRGDFDKRLADMDAKLDNGFGRLTQLLIESERHRSR